MRRDAGAGELLWQSCQSPVAHGCRLLIHPDSFHRGTLKLNIKFDADSLFCLLSHFECDGHTVHMLTQQCLLPPLTSTVRSSLFTHGHSSPCSLAARLHWCHTNCFHCIMYFLQAALILCTFSNYHQIFELWGNSDKRACKREENEQMLFLVEVALSLLSCTSRRNFRNNSWLSARIFT